MGFGQDVHFASGMEVLQWAKIYYLGIGVVNCGG